VWSQEAYRQARLRNLLPPQGAVLCNFNHLHKTSRAQWAVWASILLQLPPADTVLWTLNDNPETQVSFTRSLLLHARSLFFCDFAHGGSWYWTGEHQTRTGSQSPHIVGLFCPYSRSLLTRVWSADRRTSNANWQCMGCVANVLLMCC
jgi:hypothetical protein